MRDGKGDHEVRDSQEFGFLLGGPGLLVEGSALGAVAVVAAVVGVVAFFAGVVLALVETSAEFGRPAREDAPDGPVVGSVELAAMSTGVCCPVLMQEVCEGGDHLADEGGVVLLESAEGGEGLSGLGVADFGEVQVDEGGLEAAMSEVGGDLLDMGPTFEKMGGVAVTQGVDDKFGVLFGEPAFDFSDLESGPGAGVGHGFAIVVEGLFEGDAGGLPTAPGGGKEPVGIAMPFPKGAEPGEELRGDGDDAFVPSFGVSPGDPNGECFGVDVGGFEMEGFVEPESALIDGREKGAVATVAKGAQKPGDFLAGEDVRKRFFAFDFDFAPDLPFEVEVVPVKGSDRAEGLVDGGGRKIAFGLEVNQEVEDGATLQIGKVLAGIVSGQLFDPAEVGVGAALAKSFELDKAGEFLIPLLGSDDVLWPIYFFSSDWEA